MWALTTTLKALEALLCYALLVVAAPSRKSIFDSINQEVSGVSENRTSTPED